MADSTKGKAIDYLNEDAPISGQTWVCLSFLSPEGISNCKVRGLKVRGVYSTRKEADKRVKELQITDPDFDIFVGEVGKWLPWNPDPNDTEDQVYQEEKLNDLMKGYKENLVNAKKVQEERKREMLKKGAEVEKEKIVQRGAMNAPGMTNKTRERLRKKLEKKNAKNRIALVQNPPQTTSETTVVEESESSVVSSEVKEVESLKSDVSSISDKLERMKQLYKQLEK